MLEFDHDRCSRCGLCQRDCVAGIIAQDAEGWPAVPAELEEACLNCQHCLAVCPAAAVSCHGIRAEACQPSGPLPPPGQMLNLLRQRRSIRVWAPGGLTEAELAQACEPLNWSPTGSNSRLLHFVVVARPRLLAWGERVRRKLSRPLVRFALRLCFPRYQRFLDQIVRGDDVIFRDAPYLLVAAVHGAATCPGDDPVIALSQFEIHAQTLGIGTCWCGLAVRLLQRSRHCRAELNLPAGYRPVAAMLFGRPGIRYPRAVAPSPALPVSHC